LLNSKENKDVSFNLSTIKELLECLESRDMFFRIDVSGLPAMFEIDLKGDIAK